MATDHNSRTRGRYYDQPDTIKAVEGVLHKRVSNRADTYSGCSEALVAAGLLPMECFPGQPGMPLSRATFRPRGVKKGHRQAWFTVPGYMEVTRRPNGSFLIALTVSAEERAVREAEREARHALAESAAEEVLSELPPALRKYIEDEVSIGRRWHLERYFHDQAWLAENGISSSIASQVLHGLDVFRLADIERDLATHTMRQAAALLTRFSADRNAARGSDA